MSGGLPAVVGSSPSSVLAVGAVAKSKRTQTKPATTATETSATTPPKTDSKCNTSYELPPSRKPIDRRDVQYKDWLAMSKKAANCILEFSDGADSKKDGFVPVLHSLITMLQALEIMIMKDPLDRMASLIRDVDASMMGAYDSRDYHAFATLAKQRSLTHDVVVYNSFDHNDTGKGDESYYHCYEPFGSEMRHGITSLVRLINTPDSDRFTMMPPANEGCLTPLTKMGHAAPQVSWKDPVNLILSQQYGANNRGAGAIVHHAAIPATKLAAVHAYLTVEAKCAISFFLHEGISSQSDAKTIDAIRLSRIRCEYVFLIVHLLKDHDSGLRYHRAFTEVNGTMVTLLLCLIARIVPSTDEFLHIMNPDLCDWMLYNVSSVPNAWATFALYQSPNVVRQKQRAMSVEMPEQLKSRRLLQSLMDVARTEYQVTIRPTESAYTLAFTSSASLPARIAETIRTIDRHSESQQWSRNQLLYDALNQMSDNMFETRRQERGSVKNRQPAPPQTALVELMCTIESLGTTTEQAIVAAISTEQDMSPFLKLACLSALLHWIAGLVSDWEQDRMPATLLHTQQAHQAKDTKAGETEKEYAAELAVLERHLQKHYSTAVTRLCSLVKSWHDDPMDEMISLLHISEHVPSATITIQTLANDNSRKQQQDDGKSNKH